MNRGGAGQGREEAGRMELEGKWMWRLSTPKKVGSLVGF